MFVTVQEDAPNIAGAVTRRSLANQRASGAPNEVVTEVAIACPDEQVGHRQHVIPLVRTRPPFVKRTSIDDVVREAEGQANAAQNAKIPVAVGRYGGRNLVLCVRRAVLLVCPSAPRELRGQALPRPCVVAAFLPEHSRHAKEERKEGQRVCTSQDTSSTTPSDTAFVVELSPVDFSRDQSLCRLVSKPGGRAAANQPLRCKAAERRVPVASA
jgi:hypothetical protein